MKVTNRGLEGSRSPPPRARWPESELGIVVSIASREPVARPYNALQQNPGFHPGVAILYREWLNTAKLCVCIIPIARQLILPTFGCGQETERERETSVKCAPAKERANPRVSVCCFECVSHLFFSFFFLCIIQQRGRRIKQLTRRIAGTTRALGR